jgi:hypothetical protein
MDGTVGPTSPDFPLSKLFLQDHTMAGILIGVCKVIVKDGIDSCVLLNFRKVLFVISHHCEKLQAVLVRLPVAEVVYYWNSDGFPAVELQVVFVPSRPNHSRI